jgi:hypothetical protein
MDCSAESISLRIFSIDACSSENLNFTILIKFLWHWANHSAQGRYCPFLLLDPVFRILSFISFPFKDVLLCNKMGHDKNCTLQNFLISFCGETLYSM